MALVIGLLVLLYRGPGREIVRGHVGDVAATMLVYAVIGFVATRWRIVTRAWLTMAIALAIELGQTLWHVDSAAGSLLLGSTFDAWDIVAYVIGTFVAIGFERLALAQRDPASSVS